MATGTFGAATNIVVGNNPYHLIATDLDGDGKVDLAVAVGGTNMIAVLIGNGNGTFKTVVNYSTGAGTNPTDVAFADVDGDGKKDLIVPCYNTSNIVILKGNGDGTFQAAGTPIATGSNPRSIVAADFNGDGKIDLVTANYSSADVSVLLGLGGGAFAPAVTSSINGNGFQIAAMDLNGDGKLDLVLSTNSSRVNVGYGKGDGTFNWISYNVGSQTISTTFGDFNEDGRPDLAVADYGNSTVFLMTGDSSQPLTRRPPGQQPPVGGDPRQHVQHLRRRLLQLQRQRGRHLDRGRRRARGLGLRSAQLLRPRRRGQHPGLVPERVRHGPRRSHRGPCRPRASTGSA